MHHSGCLTMNKCDRDGCATCCGCGVSLRPVTPPRPTAPTAAEMREALADRARLSRGDLDRIDDLMAAVRAEALEDAAKVAEVPCGHYNAGMKKLPWWDGGMIATAIRALVSK